MVYTQTSLQAQHIKMNNPRAIYFNDTVSVGYIRGAGLIEVVAQDPKMGSIFYVDPPGARAAGDLRPRSAVPALPPVVGHARRARPQRADDVPAQERDGLRQRRLRRSLQADRGALGRLVCDRQESAGAPHGQLSADRAEGRHHAAAGARVARGAVRSRRLPHALQRHRRADGARAPGALQQPRHARDVGDDAGRDACALPKRPTRSPITCCSSTRRRFPAAASRDHPALPRNSRPRGRRMRKADRCASSI